jgi:putative addiction module killer protein
VYHLESTSEFDTWLTRLRDKKGKARILLRLDAVRLGHLGDVASVGDGVRELRVHFGPGYRIYLSHRGATLIWLLGGGEKSTQARDIAAAKRRAKQLESE